MNIQVDLRWRVWITIMSQGCCQLALEDSPLYRNNNDNQIYMVNK
jgi:hypothetical protein